MSRNISHPRFTRFVTFVLLASMVPYSPSAGARTAQRSGAPDLPKIFTNESAHILEPGASGILSESSREKLPERMVLAQLGDVAEGRNLIIEPTRLLFDFTEEDFPAVAPADAVVAPAAVEIAGQEYDKDWTTDDLIILEPVDGHMPDWYPLPDPFISSSTGSLAPADSIEPRAVGQDIGNISVIEDDGSLIIPIGDGVSITDTLAITRAYIQSHPDEVDTVIIFAGSNFPGDVEPEGGFAFYQFVRNSISGIGLPFFDFSEEFRLQGASRLKGMINMNDLPEYPANFADPVFGSVSGVAILGQEQEHMVAAFIEDPRNVEDPEFTILGRANAHWNFFLNTDGSVMEGNGWLEDPDTAGLFRSVAAFETFSLLDLYLFGFLAPSFDPENDPINTFLITNPTGDDVPLDEFGNPDPTAPPQLDAAINGLRTPILLQDLIEFNGPRIPDAFVAPKVIREAFILVVPRGELDTQETQDDIAKMESFRQTWVSFFSLHTNGTGSVDTRLPRPLRLQTIKITNKTADAMSVTVDNLAAPPWLRSVQPVGIVSIPGFDTIEIAVQVDPREGSGGLEVASIRITTTDPLLPSVDVQVELLTPPPTFVPDIVGLTQEAAAATLDAATLVPGNVTQGFSATVPVGHIISQDPVGGTSVPINTGVDLVVSLGAPLVQVPSVIGVSLSVAEAVLATVGLVRGDISTGFSDVIAEGLTLGQNPAAGTFVVEGSAIGIVLSLGPSAFVPDVVGLSEEDAVLAIESVGLGVGSITLEASSTVPRGRVIEQSVPAGVEVSIDSVVDLIVSLGVIVPNVLALDLSSAETQLNAQGLFLGAVGLGHSAIVGRGLVAGQSPSEGTSVDPGTSVDVVISLGPDLCDLMGSDVIAGQLADFVTTHLLSDDIDADGLPDAFALELIELVVCSGVPPELADATLNAYAANIVTLMGETDGDLVNDHAELLAVLFSISQDMQNALLGPGGILEDAGITLEGVYEAILCDGSGICIPDSFPLSLGPADSVDPLAPSPLFPYSSAGDPNGDGVTNLEIFVACPICTPEEFAALALAGAPAPTTGSGGGGGGGGCLIATAAYGTPFAEELVALRAARDRYLLRGTLGTTFVDAYYRVSPPIADVVARYPMLQAAVRLLLVPVVLLSHALLAAPLTTVLLFAFLLLAIPPFVLRARRRIKTRAT